VGGQSGDHGRVRGKLAEKGDGRTFVNGGKPTILIDFLQGSAGSWCKGGLQIQRLDQIGAV